MKKGMLFGSRAALRLFAIVVLFAWLPGSVVWGTEAIRVPGNKIVFIPPPDLNPLNQTPVPEPPQLPQFVKTYKFSLRIEAKGCNDVEENTAPCPPPNLEQMAGTLRESFEGPEGTEVIRR